MSGDVIEFPAIRAVSSKPAKRRRTARTYSPAECAAEGDIPADWTATEERMFTHLLGENNPAEAWAAIYVQRWIAREIPGETADDRMWRRIREGAWLLMRRTDKPKRRKRQD